MYIYKYCSFFFSFFFVFFCVFFQCILCTHISNEILSTINKLVVENVNFAPFLLFGTIISCVFTFWFSYLVFEPCVQVHQQDSGFHVTSFLQIFCICTLHEMMNLDLLMKTFSQVTRAPPWRLAAEFYARTIWY